MTVILADTGPLVALLNPRDQHHGWAMARFSEFTEPLVTCEPVLTEALFLLGASPGGAAALLSLWDRGSLLIDFSAEREKPTLRKLLTKYRDLPMSFADACLVRMTELHADVMVWTLDSHFGVYRRAGRQSIPRIVPVTT
jgi:predicted nucleic acid-binding protein